MQLALTYKKHDLLSVDENPCITIIIKKSDKEDNKLAGAENMIDELQKQKLCTDSNLPFSTLTSGVKRKSSTEARKKIFQFQTIVLTKTFFLFSKMRRTTKVSLTNHLQILNKVAVQ